MSLRSPGVSQILHDMMLTFFAVFEEPLVPDCYQDIPSGENKEQSEKAFIFWIRLKDTIYTTVSLLYVTFH